MPNGLEFLRDAGREAVFRDALSSLKRAAEAVDADAKLVVGMVDRARVEVEGNDYQAAIVAYLRSMSTYEVLGKALASFAQCLHDTAKNDAGTRAS